VNRSRVLILTLLAMIAFASNSLLCRLALKHTTIDAATFTLDRILSGAIALWVVVAVRRKLRVERTAPSLVESSSTSSLVTRHSSLAHGNWPSALALYIYAAAFSFAYLTLSAGTGALLLFGAVQATMISWGLRKGERLNAIQIAGLIAALGGLVLLLLPGLTAPPLIGSALMLAAGVAWGIYSLRGKSETNPGGATAGNFVRAVPLAVLLSLIMIKQHHFDSLGLTYAVVSGAITSGLGYVIWYSALPGLKATSAATVQLSVPVLAAVGGIILLGESLTLRFVIASIAILGGIALVIVEKKRRLA
jgi:drug/metabolite transporter (DMT)-like permease